MRNFHQTSSLCEIISTTVESAERHCIFSYFLYDELFRLKKRGIIQHKYGLPHDVSKIDAAFIWRGNGRLYLFADRVYYRFDDYRGRIDYGYPKPIQGNWKGLPESVDGVTTWRNKKTYFFEGNNR